MDWFLYDGDFRNDRVNVWVNYHKEAKISIDHGNRSIVNIKYTKSSFENTWEKPRQEKSLISVFRYQESIE